MIDVLAIFFGVVIGVLFTQTRFFRKHSDSFIASIKKASIKQGVEKSPEDGVKPENRENSVAGRAKPPK